MYKLNGTFGVGILVERFWKLVVKFKEAQTEGCDGLD